LAKLELLEQVGLLLQSITRISIQISSMMFLLTVVSRQEL
jgi:hypothetical protein